MVIFRRKLAAVLLATAILLTAFPDVVYARDGYVYGYVQLRTGDPPTNPWVNQDMFHARDALWRTGWGCYAWGGIGTGYPDYTWSSVIDNLNRAGAGVLYVSTHGGTNGTYSWLKTSTGYYTDITSYDISTYNYTTKTVVYLDACQTGTNRIWSNAFSIWDGVSPGGFLGWNGDMYLNANYCWFTEIVWDSMSGYGGNPWKSLGDAALAAQGATGITNWRIYGNRYAGLF